MSEEDKNNTTSRPLAAPHSPKPESPTTARPLDFDDEPQESGLASAPSAPSQRGTTEAAPPKPPRPLSPKQQAESTLKEAFPTVDASVVKAVLVASNWNVEQAFHALLGMTDPNAQEDLAPPKPPRPSATQRQLESDEMYARQLAEHYNRRAQPRYENDPRYEQTRRGSEQSEERDYSFFEDDLPVIRDNIRKGFLETQSKVNSWVQNLKKRMDGEEEAEGSQPSQSYGESQGYNRPRRSGDMSRRSGDRERYDADPQVLGDDFSALELRDSEAPPARPPRPLANTDLHKTSSPSPDRRKVSFQEGPPEEIGNLYDSSEPIKPASSAKSKSSKWQPLSTVEPSPVGENDPFSLGDSDDERDSKPKDQNTADENDRTKKATTEVMAGDLNSASKDVNKTDNTGKS
ncbi:hypothetical protein AWENTII_000620 [Aspergillus wentii]|nr:ubiquitin-binding protein cue5 [Aspergillus wentii]